MPHVAASAPPRTSANCSRTLAMPALGDWQLVELMYNGRWSSVWRARPSGGRTAHGEYALKVVTADHADAGCGWQMLRREAFVSRAVAHRHLITVLSSHTAHLPALVVMPLLEGATLAAAIQATHVVPLGQALWLTRQVAEALAALDERGWLHGDVKPENVIVQPDGHATLIDLGFAQQIGASTSLASRTFCGTLRYAAPERFVSTTALSGRSDCYSLGVMLFEMLAGRIPFDARDPHAWAVAHLEQTPADVREFVPQAPREVSGLLQQLLAKDPLRRPTAAELVRRLCRLEIESLDSRTEWRLLIHGEFTSAACGCGPALPA